MQNEVKCNVSLLHSCTGKQFVNRIGGILASLPDEKSSKKYPSLSSELSGAIYYYTHFLDFYDISVTSVTLMLRCAAQCRAVPRCAALCRAVPVPCWAVLGSNIN